MDEIRIRTHRAWRLRSPNPRKPTDQYVLPEGEYDFHRIIARDGQPWLVLYVTGKEYGMEEVNWRKRMRETVYEFRAEIDYPPPTIEELAFVPRWSTTRLDGRPFPPGRIGILIDPHGTYLLSKPDFLEAMRVQRDAFHYWRDRRNDVFWDRTTKQLRELLGELRAED